MKSWMKSSKVLGGLISIIFFVILFSGLSSAGPTESFDAGNSCFCKSEDLGVFGAILCNLEKTLYIFFNTSLQCHKETPPPSSAAGSFGGGEGGPSKAAAAAQESGDRDVGAECDNSGQCKGDLVCAIFTAKDMDLGNLKRDGLAPVLKVGDKDLKKGEYAYCAELSFGNLRVNKECRLDKECSSPPLTVINDKVYYCDLSAKKPICKEFPVSKLICDPKNQLPGALDFCVASIPNTKAVQKITVRDRICSSEEKCIPPLSKAPSASCITDRECTTGFCPAGICAACKSDIDCENNEYCDLGKCEKKFEDWDFCILDNQCLSGICEDNHCKPKEKEEEEKLEPVKQEETQTSALPSSSQQIERKEVTLPESTKEGEIFCDLNIENRLLYKYIKLKKSIFNSTTEQPFKKINENITSTKKYSEPWDTLSHTTIIQPWKYEIKVSGVCTQKGVGLRSFEYNNDKIYFKTNPAETLKNKILQEYSCVKFKNERVHSIIKSCAEYCTMKSKEKVKCEKTIEDTQNIPFTPIPLENDIFGKTLWLKLSIKVLSKYSGPVFFEKNTNDIAFYNDKKLYSHLYLTTEIYLK